METLKLAWQPDSKKEFELLRKRAADAGRLADFVRAHNEIVLILRNPELAFEKGELLYRTQKPGGEVRLLLNRMIAVCYAAFRHEKTGWIVKYKSVPDEWPLDSE